MKNVTSHGLESVSAGKVQRNRIAVRTKGGSSLALVAVGLLWVALRSALAGGGGENMLLVVNPNDEPSLRIANAYVKARNIPINNIIYITSPGIGITESDFTTRYRTPILDAIASRGLTNQIDYIGTIGSPHTLSTATGKGLSFHDCLNHLTQLQNGMTCDQIMYRYSELMQSPPPTTNSYTYKQGTNPAIRHSQLLIPTGASGTANSVQWYMTGMIGYSGERGLTSSQAIENLQRTVKGDGTNPQGTIYFEDSQEIRTIARSPFWHSIQVYLDSIRVPWIQEKGITPKNRSDVRGAVVGSAGPIVSTQFVNGSAYLPGSWADDLTSFGGGYGIGNSQTVVSNFLLAGAAGAAGTVTEPTADASRFTYPSIFIFSNDGSTLGEAYYKSVNVPDLLMFQGDLLSQPYADVPEVTFTAGPADGDTVSGTISVSASARLNNPRIATGIAQLKLCVDGVIAGEAVSGESGSFSLDTTALTDGIHEVRVIALNNSQAESEGYTLKKILVNNKGQSVTITGTNSYSAAWDQTLSIPVTANQGSGSAITAIQLQLLGRTVGSINSPSGSVSLDVTKIAYGTNTITPVAILASGTQQVQGTPITVTRFFQQFPGRMPTLPNRRNPGYDFYFFGNSAYTNSTLDSINFNATPSYTLHSTSSSINPGITDNPGSRNMPTEYQSGGYYARNLAIMIKSNFTVATAGEYLFSTASHAYTSFGLYIDGVAVTKTDGWNGSTWTSIIPNRGIYLLPGEHTLTVKLAQSRSGRTAYETGFTMQMRGPDGNTSGVSGYTTDKRVSP